MTEKIDDPDNPMIWVVLVRRAGPTLDGSSKKRQLDSSHFPPAHFLSVYTKPWSLKGNGDVFYRHVSFARIIRLIIKAVGHIVTYK